MTNRQQVVSKILHHPSQSNPLQPHFNNTPSYYIQHTTLTQHSILIHYYIIIHQYIYLPTTLPGYTYIIQLTTTLPQPYTHYHILLYTHSTLYIKTYYRGYMALYRGVIRYKAIYEYFNTDIGLMGCISPLV